MYSMAYRNGDGIILAVNSDQTHLADVLVEYNSTLLT